LKGKALKLITVDGNPALLKVLRELSPQRRIQHYIVHRLRNVAVRLKRYQRPACMGEARVIFGALSRTEATRRFKACRAKCLVGRKLPFAAWRRACSTASASRRSSWRTIRTTDILERAFGEVRRRRRLTGVFLNAEWAERIMYAVTQGLNAAWEEHPLRQVQQNT
jgi:transposase-like protein